VDGRYLLAADGALVQVGSVAQSEFQKHAAEESAAQLLAAHRDWEAKFAGAGKTKSAEIELGAAGPGLMWSFDAKADPAAMKGSEIDPTTKQLYLTWLDGERVVVLNSAVNSHTSQDQARALLEGVAKSFHASRESIDVEKSDALD
jgi:hypothetical protein